jgi:hypothetical protein
MPGALSLLTFSFARVHVCLVDYSFAKGNATMWYDICQKIGRLYAHENAGLTVSVKLAVGFHSTEQNPKRILLGHADCYRRSAREHVQSTLRCAAPSPGTEIVRERESSLVNIASAG